MFRHIAIVGGGAAGASLLSELLTRRTQPPLLLDWYTGSGTPARGVAYGGTSPRQLLNVRAASMSLFAGQPRGFLDFVQREQPDIAGTDFLPRSRYGDYLESEVAHALQLGRAYGHDVNIIPFPAAALIPERHTITVLQGEFSRVADAAVLALGALPPRALAGVSARALASGRYVVDPWQLLARPDETAVAPRHVLVIGLGLTAVDVLLELSARWPDTHFTALSRHGVLPAAHLHRVMTPDGDSAAWIASMYDAPEIHAWLRLVREATAHGEWRTVVDSLRPHTSALWQALPGVERARFLRHARWAWERVRHRMPPQVAEAMAALEHSGRLQRTRGRMLAVNLVDDALRVRIGHAGVTRTLHADLVIQSTGLETSVQHTTHPLVRHLLHNTHVESDPLGLGLCADRDGHLQHGGESWPHLFALGSLLRGTLWESTAMPEIRLQVRHVADQLLAD
jgi:uncharacterized NAD(P)/FAD-binding protein YdhS